MKIYNVENLYCSDTGVAQQLNQYDVFITEHSMGKIFPPIHFCFRFIAKLPSIILKEIIA